jgi:hypothetical protein
MNIVHCIRFAIPAFLIAMLTGCGAFMVSSNHHSRKKYLSYVGSFTSSRQVGLKAEKLLIKSQNGKNSKINAEAILFMRVNTGTTSDVLEIPVDLSGAYDGENCIGYLKGNVDYRALDGSVTPISIEVTEYFPHNSSPSNTTIAKVTIPSELQLGNGTCEIPGNSIRTDEIEQKIISNPSIPSD